LHIAALLVETQPINTKTFEALTSTAERLGNTPWGTWIRAIVALIVLVLLLGMMTKKIKFHLTLEVGTTNEKQRPGPIVGSQ
jgi:hypothetical protein